jgi:arylsulfatase A-like enzyme/Tfp pilus assembly protein PilF
MTHQRRKLVLGALLALLAAGGALVLLLSRSARPLPNVLIITLDTTRADRIGAYGCRRARTPNIDRLAGEGALFSDCHACVPMTLPSHCTLFTGLYPIAHNVRNNGTYFLNPQAWTLAEALKPRGYETYAVIASFVLLSKFGLNQGFDVYEDALDPYELKHDYKSEIRADQVFAKFSRWFAGERAGRFFAWVHLYDPHDPYDPPAAVAKFFPDDPLGRYDGEIANADIYLGKIVDALRARGVLDDTLLLVVGDHGEAFGEHQERGHAVFCYRENLHVPLILRYPRAIAAGRKVAVRADLTDIMPTVLDLLGLAVPEEVQGRSLRPWLKGTAADPEREFYVESMYGREEKNWAPLTGIVAGGYKYISLPDPELYELKKDPAERHNLFKMKNILARELDRRLARLVAAGSRRGVKTSRELSASDRRELESLGYISAFSRRSEQTMDPKRGIVVDNRLREIRRLIKQEKADEAERQIRRLRDEHPGLSMPQWQYVVYELALLRRDSAGAVKALQDGIAAFPDMEQFRLPLASAYFAAKRYDKAEEQCRQMLAAHPGTTRALMLMAEIRERQGRLDEAGGFYAQALELEPQNAPLRIKHAELLLAAGQYPQAVAAYNQVLARPEAGNDPEMLLKVALLNAKYGTPEMAERQLAQAVAIRPAGKFFFNYALILAKNGKHDEALASMETAFGRYGKELNAEQRRIAERTLAAWR